MIYKKVIIIVMFLVSLYSVNAILLSEYNFDVDYTDSQGKWDGSNNGATISGTAYRGNSTYLDGTDYIDVANSQINNSDFTIAAWVRVTSAATEQRIYSSTWTPVRMYFGYNSNAFNIRIGDSGSITTGSPTTGKWEYVMLSWNNATGNMSLFVNGTMIYNKTGVVFDGNPTNLAIGTYNQGEGNNLTGYIDEMCIWNTSTTTASAVEVFNNYTLGYDCDGTFLDSYGDVLYFDSNTGSDSNFCTDTAPCKTITKLNSLSTGGKTVLFNGTFRMGKDAYVDVTSSTTYGEWPNGDAYLYGSMDGSNASCWNQSYTNLWSWNCTSQILFDEVGAIYLPNESTVVKRERFFADVDAQDEFFSNSSNDNILWYSVGNPATVHTGQIEIAEFDDTAPTSIPFDIGNTNNIVIENLTIRYGAYSGIGGNTAWNIANHRIYNNTVEWVGSNANSQDWDGTGNCISYSNGLSNIDIMYNKIAWCWDGGITNSNWNANKPWDDVVVSYNIIKNAGFGYEQFNNQAGSPSTNIKFQHNTIYESAYGWVGDDDDVTDGLNNYAGYGIRLNDLSDGENITIADNIIYNSTSGHVLSEHDNIVNFNVTNNIYYYHDNPVSGNSRWGVIESTAYNTLIAAQAAKWAGNDTNSVEQDPLFLDITNNDPTPQANSPACNAASDGTDIGAIPCAEGGTNVSNQMYQALSAETFSDNMGTGTYNYSTRWSTINVGNWEVAQVNTGAGYSNYMLIGNNTVTVLRGGTLSFNPVFNTVELITQIMPITEQTDYSNPHCSVGFDNTYNMIGWRNSSGNMSVRSAGTWQSYNVQWTKNTSKWVRIIFNHTTQNNTFYYKNSTTDAWSYLGTEVAYTSENMRVFIRANDAKCAFDNIILRKIGNEQNSDTFAPSFIYHSLNDTVWKSATIQYHDSVGSVYNDTFNSPTHATDMSRTLYPSTWTLNITLCDNNNICSNTTTAPVTTYNSKIVNITDVTGNPIASFCTFNGDAYTGSDLNLSMVNITDLTLSCSAQPGFEAFTTEIVLNSSNQAVTRNTAMLLITFSETVYVVISDTSNVAYYQNTTTINITQTNLSIGKVRIDYGTTANHGQVYEYYNDWNTNINETLQVLDNIDTNFYAAAETASGYRLDDAYIYVYQYNKTTDLNSMNMVQTGQYMTDNKKPTLINLDSDKLYWIQVEKAGYSAPPLKNIHPDNITGSLDAPFVFELIKSPLDITSPWAVWVTPYPLINVTPGQDITLHIQLPTYVTKSTANRFYITTNYRESDGAANGLALTTVNSDTRYWKEMINEEDCDFFHIQCNVNRRFNVTLIEGTDFNWNDTQINVTMLAYYDLNYRYDSTIVPLVRVGVGTISIETDTGWSSTIIAVVIFIIVVLGAAFIKYFTQSQDMAFHTYMVGLIVVAAIAQAFYIVAGITVLYYGLRWVSQASGGGGDA